MSRTIRDVKWTITLTMCGVLLLSTTLADVVSSQIHGLYTRFNPVVEMRGELVSAGQDYSIIHITGRKFRECKYISMQAFSLNQGIRSDAEKLKVASPDDGYSKPPGLYDLGNWRIWPTDGADTVEMYVIHDCNGYPVTTRIAEVKL
jgi:hypothetical protein